MIIPTADTEERRSPHGECGLKFEHEQEMLLAVLVAPRMGSVD